MLQNRFYLGEPPGDDGAWLPGKHAPLINAALFPKGEAARVRTLTRACRVHTERCSASALSGLARCACGATMTAYGHVGGRQRLQCSRRTQTKDCDAPTFYAEVVEEQIGPFLAGLASPEPDRSRLVSVWRERQHRRPSTEAEREAPKRNPARLRVLFLDGDLD